MLHTNSPGKHPNGRRVLLVRLPPFLGYKGHHPRDVTLPLPIAYIATMAEQAGWKAKVLDVWATDVTMADVLRRIREFDPGVIFFEAHAPPFPVISKCAEAVRKFSDTKMVAFGSLPTFMPERVVGPDLPINVAIKGESEFTGADLLDAFENQRPLADVAGISYWDEQRGELHRTPDRPAPDNLDELPIINYDLFDLAPYHKYSFPVPIHRRVRWGHIMTTRGCPYPCTHCSFDHRQSFGRKFRKHSPKRVVDEMELLINKYGRTAISFEDDIFTMDRQYAMDVSDEIIARGVKVVWIIQTRVDRVDRELIKKMKQAGLVGVSLGIESGNDRVLEVLKKGFTREQALDGIRICQEEGMMLRLLYMIGNPTETAEEIEDTISLTLQAKAITVQVHISTPYPGTGLLNTAEDDGRYIQDFSSYNEVVYNLSRVPDDELWKLQKQFYKKYFFSWSYFKTFMRQRMWYMAGSWQRDVPLILRAFMYLVWSSRRQTARDIESTLIGIDDIVPAEHRQLAAADKSLEPAADDEKVHHKVPGKPDVALKVVSTPTGDEAWKPDLEKAAR